MNPCAPRMQWARDTEPSLGYLIQGITRIHEHNPSLLIIYEAPYYVITVVHALPHVEGKKYHPIQNAVTHCTPWSRSRGAE